MPGHWGQWWKNYEIGVSQVEIHRGKADSEGPPLHELQHETHRPRPLTRREKRSDEVLVGFVGRHSMHKQGSCYLQLHHASESLAQVGK